MGIAEREVEDWGDSRLGKSWYNSSTLSLNYCEGLKLKKTILCLSPTGAQMIRDAKLAEYVPKLFSNFIFTPMPSGADGLDFYNAQIAQIKATESIGYGYYSSRQYLESLRRMFRRLENSEIIELWVEPSLNSHIHAFHLLTVLAKIPSIQRKLCINHTTNMVGLMNSETLNQTEQQPRITANRRVLREAETYWNAFRDSSPKKWIELLGEISEYFPVFDKIKIRFALQLPLEPSGMRLVDRQVLKYVSQSVEKTVYVLGNVLADQMDDFHILDERAIWDSIFTLADATNPAITGLPLEHFDYYSQSSSNKILRKKCFDSKPRLTSHGVELLNDEASWLNKNEVDYWWGGTHITNNNYWSFDPVGEKLTQPRL